MDQHNKESGADFILDSRSLIVGFVLLMVVCGAFFIIGYMEGKRQGLQGRIDVLPASSMPSESALPSAQDPRNPESEQAAKEVDERTVTAQLDWYRNISQREESSEKGKQPAKAAKAVSVPPPGEVGSSAKAAKEGAKAPTSEPATKVAARETEGITYSVQVGAFRQRREAEVMAAKLKAKGYVGFIESPRPGSELYLLKIGRFDSRADAVTMQLRLKKDGIDSFIKSN